MVGYYILRVNQVFISSIAVLPTGCAVLNYILTTQLFLQSQIIPHRKHCIDYNKIANGVFRDATHSVVQVFLSLTNIIQFQSKRVNINLFTSVSKVHVPGYLSWYGDSVRAGRSDDRIPVRARISATVQAGPGAHTASCTMGTGYLAGRKAVGARC